jgi:hypothetical protein
VFICLHFPLVLTHSLSLYANIHLFFFARCGSFFRNINTMRHFRFVSIPYSVILRSLIYCFSRWTYIPEHGDKPNLNDQTFHIAKLSTSTNTSKYTYINFVYDASYNFYASFCLLHPIFLLIAISFRPFVHFTLLPSHHITVILPFTLFYLIKHNTRKTQQRTTDTYRQIDYQKLSPACI